VLSEHRAVYKAAEAAAERTEGKKRGRTGARTPAGRPKAYTNTDWFSDPKPLRSVRCHSLAA